MSSFAPLPPNDVPAMAALMSESFNMPAERCQQWVVKSGLPHWRAFRDDDAILGGLLRIPMAQIYGGRPVTMTGLAGVAVSTAGRGKRTGQRMMRETLEEMRRDGTALSALYGSTTSFYRRCGYERAGSRMMAEVPLRELPGRSGPLEVRDLAESDHPALEQFQASHSKEHGALVRGEYVWHRTRNPRGMVTQGFGFYRDGQLEGYAYLVKNLGTFKENSLEVTDLVLTTPDSLTTFLGLLAGYRAFFTTARWPSSPSSPVLLSMPEPWQYSLMLEEHWLLRIVSLDAAIAQRGYPAHLSSEIHLSVDDPWFGENSGSFVLKVDQGRATLKAGGNGDLALDIGALAGLYSGFISAESLALAGRATGSKEALANASAIFGGQTPELNDFF